MWLKLISCNTKQLRALFNNTQKKPKKTKKTKKNPINQSTIFLAYSKPSLINFQLNHKRLCDNFILNCLNENCLKKIKVIKPKLRKLAFPEIVHHQQGSKEGSRVSGSQCYESTLFEFPGGRRLSLSNDVFSRRRQQPSNRRLPSERRR
jgi:hypothetical protein